MFGTWSFDYRQTSLPDGTYNFTATATDLMGSVSNPSTPFKVSIDGTAPAISSVIVNDGNRQRSMVKTLTVNFTEPITLNSAVQLKLRNGAAVANVTLAVSNPSLDKKTYLITFTGSAVLGGSLPDGLFNLIVSAAGVHDVAGNAMAANYTARFHRLFGDADGDRDVDQADLAAFRLALNRPTHYVWWFDYTFNSAIDNGDYLQLRQRLIKPLL